MMRALTVGFILLFFMRKEGFVTRYSSIVGLYSAEIKLRHTLFIYRRSVLDRNQASSRVIHLLSVCTRQKSNFVTRYSSIVGSHSAEIKLSTADTILLMPCLFTSTSTYFKYSGNLLQHGEHLEHNNGCNI